MYILYSKWCYGATVKYMEAQYIFKKKTENQHTVYIFLKNTEIGIIIEAKKTLADLENGLNYPLCFEATCILAVSPTAGFPSTVRVFCV